MGARSSRQPVGVGIAQQAGQDRDFSFQTWPFYWLARASGQYLQNMETALKRIGLDIPRWRVLMVLHEQECASVSEIADHAISKLPTMTKIVQRMQAEGLVICGSRSSDGRVTEVRLTEAGVEAGKKAWTIANCLYERAFNRMTKSEVSSLSRLLEKLAGNLLDQSD